MGDCEGEEDWDCEREVEVLVREKEEGKRGGE